LTGYAVNVTLEEIEGYGVCNFWRNLRFKRIKL
jgi:hypothetical protein